MAKTSFLSTLLDNLSDATYLPDRELDRDQTRDLRLDGVDAQPQYLALRSSTTPVASMSASTPSLRAPGGGSGGGGSGGGGSGGGGGRPPGGGETATNNLSFPVIWAEGQAMTIPGTPGAFSFTTPYDLNRDGQITTADQINKYYQFAQKTAGNVWQADSVLISEPQTVAVNSIDWGDSLESRPISVGRPVRIELTLYKTLEGSTLTAYPMEVLANPSSPNEVQGAGATTYPISGTLHIDSEVNTVESSEATVYSPDARLAIQQLVGDVPDDYLIWNGTRWTDPNPNDAIGVKDPVTGINFAGELNVAGKVIYGLSQGGWKPTAAGEYRITFYLPVNGNTQLDDAVPINVGGEGETGYTTPIVVGGDSINLTYIDVQAISGGSGGGGGKPSRTLAEPIVLGASDRSMSNVELNEGLGQMPLAAAGEANPLQVRRNA